MKKYRVHHSTEHRLEVLRTLRKFENMKVDNMDVHSVGIVINAENMDYFYQKILAKVRIALGAEAAV